MSPWPSRRISLSLFLSVRFFWCFVHSLSRTYLVRTTWTKRCGKPTVSASPRRLRAFSSEWSFQKLCCSSTALDRSIATSDVKTRQPKATTWFFLIIINLLVPPRLLLLEMPDGGGFGWFFFRFPPPPRGFGRSAALKLLLAGRKRRRRASPECCSCFHACINSSLSLSPPLFFFLFLSAAYATANFLLQALPLPPPRPCSRSGNDKGTPCATSVGAPAALLRQQGLCRHTRVCVHGLERSEAQQQPPLSVSKPSGLDFFGGLLY